MSAPIYEGDSNIPTPLKLQLSGSFLGTILTLLSFLVITVLFVGSKTSRGDVKEIVDDRVLPIERIFEQQNKALLEKLEELRQEVRRTK